MFIGQGQIKLVDLSDCEGDYCIIHKGKDLKLHAELVPQEDAEHVKIVLKAMMNGIEIPVPGIDTDGCKHMKCPLKKGERVSFDYSMNIPKILPDIKAVVTAELVNGDNGDVLSCANVKGEIKA